jgi:hypothetical protein
MVVFKVSKRVFVRAMISKKERRYQRRASHRLLIRQIRRHNCLSSLRASLSSSTRTHHKPSRRRSRSTETAVLARLCNPSMATLYRQFKDQEQSRGEYLYSSMVMENQC